MPLKRAKPAVHRKAPTRPAQETQTIVNGRRVQLLTNAGIKRPLIEIIFSRKPETNEVMLKHYLTLSLRQREILRGLHHAIKHRKIRSKIPPNLECLMQLKSTEQLMGRKKMLQIAKQVSDGTKK